MFYSFSLIIIFVQLEIGITQDAFLLFPLTDYLIYFHFIYNWHTDIILKNAREYISGKKLTYLF